MKIKSIFAIVAAAATVLFAGCDPKEPDLGAAAITLKSDATINLASAESSQTVKFVATRNWTASVSENAADWIAVTPASGKASAKEQTVTIDVPASTFERFDPSTNTVRLVSGRYELLYGTCSADANLQAVSVKRK